MVALPACNLILGIEDPVLIQTTPDAALFDALPPGVPGVASDVVAVARVGGVFDITWTAPTSAGSFPISEYQIESTPTGLSTTSTTTSLTTPALTVGTAYVFHVRAVNAAGPGAPASSPEATCADVPGAPTNVMGMALSARGKATWSAAPENGSPITRYTVTASPGGKSVSVGGLATEATINALPTGTYTLTVTASNDLGTGPGAVTGNINVTCVKTNYVLNAADSTTVEYGGTLIDQEQATMDATKDATQNRYGWAKFNLSGIPEWGMVAGPPDGPELHLWLGATSGTRDFGLVYSKDDGWTRAGIPQPAAIERTTAVGSPGNIDGTLSAYKTLALDFAARDWSADIADANDRVITVGIHNKATGSGSFGGSSNIPAGSRPLLDIWVCE